MPPKRRVALVCWSKAAPEYKRALTGFGYKVDPVISRGSGAIGKLAAAAPQAIIIDLDKQPAYGREIATVFRNSPSTVHMPLIFAGGLPEKIPNVRAEIPDAVYCAWKDVQAGIEQAIAKPPIRPVRPRARGEAVVSGSVLARKFRIKPEHSVAILGDVIGLGKRLAIEYDDRVSAQTSIALAVVRTANELEAALELASGQLPKKAILWIVHPKQSGKLRSDFNQTDVVMRAPAFGFSGFMMCAVDADWSAFRLNWKKK